MSDLACSVIIRAYNEEKHIGRLLEGILQQNLQPLEIILVDSGSTDATQTTASRYPVRIVHISPQEFTFGRSLNLGIAEAQANLLVFASAHVYPVYPDWLEKLLRPFEDSQVALTYGKQRGTLSSYFSENQIFARWFPDQPAARQPHPFCNNANAAIRRSVWETRPYDESLPGLEDLDWANWAYQAGYALAYVPEAEIIHVHNETPNGVFNRYRREAMAFKRIFPQEHFRLGDCLSLFCSNAFNDMRQAKRQNLLRRSLTSILWFRWMQFWGTYQGYRQAGPLTWQLKQTFYYPGSGLKEPLPDRRDMKPIHYQETGEKP